MDFSLTPLFGGDTGIAQTASKIKDAVYYSLREPRQLIRKRAESLIRTSNIPERDELEEIKTLSRFVKDRFHYVRDPQGLEYVKSPEVIDEEISRYGEFIGDCDDASGYLAALLKSLGYHVNLTVVADPRNTRQNFSHIFTRAYSPKLKRWISLDMTAKGKPLGWNVTPSRMRSYDV